MATLIKRGKKFYSDYTENGKRIRRALSKDRFQAEGMLEKMLEVKRSNRHGYFFADNVVHVVLFNRVPSDILEDIRSRYAPYLHEIMRVK